MRYLVTGLESSCTKIASKMVAYNLNLIDSVNSWDAYDTISDDLNLVCHRSIPHGVDNYFIDLEFAMGFDYVLLSIRDWNCSMISKTINHEHNLNAAYDQHVSGVETMKEILHGHPNTVLFSPEIAYVLQDSYTSSIIRSLGIDKPRRVVFDNPNKKYLKEVVK
jgi:hypothetical protein